MINEKTENAIQCSALLSTCFVEGDLDYEMYTELDDGFYAILQGFTTPDGSTRQLLHEDGTSLDEIFPGKEKLDIQHHRRTIVKHRMRRFYPEEVDPNAKLVWIFNDNAVK